MTQPNAPLIARYPTAIRILAAASHVDLHLERIPDPIVDPKEIAVVRVRVGDGPAHDVVVDNEYEDANSGHRPLLLALVLRSLHDYRDGEGFDAWCKEQFLDSEHPRFRELYEWLGPAAEAFADRFEPLHPVDGYAWSVNSDGAQALRRIARGEV